MKTPSKYPVLDNRPIDQWRVTELKEELKRRKLTIGGLKQDLIKRLDEALRVEKDSAEEENDNGVEEPNVEIVTEAATKQNQAVSDVDESGIDIPDNSEQTVGDADDKGTEANVVSVHVDSKDSAQQQVEDISLAKEKSVSVTDNAAGMDVVTATDIPSANMEDKVCDGLSSDAAMAGPGLHDDKMEGDNEDSRAQQDSENVKQLHEDVKLDSSDPNNQVSEVNTNLGIPIKSNSISTDSVSISEKHDLEVNIITDNAKLEHDVMPEMVQPSSSNLAPDGKSHPTDVEEPHENKLSVDSTDNNNTNADMSQKNHSADLGSSEKLNLDRSSGDDSMEEDALESKQIDSNCNSEEVGERPEKSEVITMKGERPFAIMDTDLPKEDKGIHVENKDVMAASFEKKELQDRSSGDDSMEEDALESKKIDSNCNSEEVGEGLEKSEVVTMKGESPSTTMDTDLPKEGKDIHIENKDVMDVSFEKRKVQDQEAVLNNEPSKRQRRWKSENTNVREPQISKSIPAASAKNVTPSLKRNLSGSITVGANDASKEREVPPSTKAPTSSLRIDRFLRPFTLKAVQELLAKTGTVTSFWMDHIKTHCYVTYSSVEEAVETRNAVYNLQWPPNGGRNLIADFVDPQDLKMRVEAPSQPPVTPVNTAPEPSTLPQPSPRQQNLRQQMPQPTLPPPPPLSNPGQVRERAHPPPPPAQEKIEAPIVTLDDLFRKTKATPRIYYLPLSEELVLAKVEARRKNSRQ